MWLFDILFPKRKAKPAAGCIFTDTRYVLAGYQPHKKTPHISGIGGTQKKGETLLETALRETVEELLEINIQPSHLKELLLLITPKCNFKHGKYTTFVYTFKDLDRILEFMNSYAYVSSLYAEFPRIHCDLIWSRGHSSAAEISHLCLLPLVDHSPRNPFVDKAFMKDLAMLRALVL
jgi:8-oxo-dGTP pyrophosphatase MutT (NUDIX family)